MIGLWKDGGLAHEVEVGEGRRDVTEGGHADTVDAEGRVHVDAALTTGGWSHRGRGAGGVGRDLSTYTGCLGTGIRRGVVERETGILYEWK